MRGSDLKARYHELYLSIQAPYEKELATAGLFRRLRLRYLIARKFNEEKGKPVECDIVPKRSKSEIIIGLMGSSGIMLLIYAVPVGIAMGLESHYKFYLEIRESMILSVEMILLMALTGVILSWLCLHLTKRRRGGAKAL